MPQTNSDSLLNILLRCVAPHECSSRISGLSVRPYGVRPYSIKTGTVSWTSLSASSFISSSFNSFDSIFGVSPGISRWICLKRFLPNFSDRIICSFHLPLSISRASLTGKIILEQSPVEACAGHFLLSSVVVSIVTKLTKIRFLFYTGFPKYTGILGETSGNRASQRHSFVEI